MNLYLLKYNNYYNRIVKKEDNLADYLPYSLGPIIQNVNFIPGDNVLTTQIVNWNGEDPDYVLVTTNEGAIDSRWFVIETVRTRQGQLELTLHRDLVVDFYNSIINAPCFIEKATIRSVTDPAIFNKEDMTFNQIKTAQYPLTDKSNTAWIVGYVPRDSFTTDTEVKTNFSYDGAADISGALSSWKYFKYTNIGDNEAFYGYVKNEDITYKINTYTYGEIVYSRAPKYKFYEDFTINMTGNGQYTGTSNFVTKGGAQGTASPTYTGDRSYYYSGSDANVSGGATGSIQVTVDGNAVCQGFTSSVMTKMNDYVRNYYTYNHTQAEVEEFQALNNKIFHDTSNDIYYRITVKQHEGTITLSVPITSGGLYNEFYNNLNKSKFSGNPNAETFKAEEKMRSCSLVLQQLSTEVSVKISANRYHLNDSPYDMFCIPFPRKGQNLVISQNGEDWIDGVDRAAGFAIAEAITTATGSNNIYDLQLLPYCPIQVLLSKTPGYVDVGSYQKSDIKVKYNDSTTGNIVSVLLWATQSQFSFEIPFRIDAGRTVLEKKIRSETELWRLCSPNYSGLFDFDLQKNNGIYTFNVDCTYRPFNPYIHINPNFQYLYGADWNDSRGLICGGDFSLPLVTNAWADYELQNKNYQQMFDRQIQNMEVNNSVQRQKEALGAITSTVGGAVGGAMAGAKKGGVYGAIAGGVTGAVGGVAGSFINASLNEKLRNEALDYKRDMFGYELGNIQALPQGLAKVSAFTANNMIFPFLEQYQCTSTEVQALVNKLKYNGMTIMRIGTLSQFIFENEEPSYIKGRLIRLEDLSEDYHIATAIADEIFKGVFI